MGLQIALVGMTSVQLVVPNAQTIVGLGDIHNYQIWFSLFGLLLIGSLLFHQVHGAILIGILVMTLLTWYVEDSYPQTLFQFPSLHLEPARYINFTDFNVLRCLPGIAAFMFIGIIDVSGVIFGMASLAQITEPDGSIPGAKETFLATSVGSLVSAATGGTPIIVYVESAAGIKEGGRTGLTAVLISLFFLLSILVAPILATIPLTATSPVAILVGAMMMSQSVEIDWNNMSEAIPAFLTLIIMPFTFSITNGIVFGLIAAFVFYVTTGQAWQDVKDAYYGTTHHHVSAADKGHGSSSSPTKQTELSRLHSRGGSIHSDHSDDSTTLDHRPFVRTPSLILSKRDADSVMRARGMSVDPDGHSPALHGHSLFAASAYNQVGGSDQAESGGQTKPLHYQQQQSYI
jgi:xanthine/uracil/vitamin C permease (AzgA family)